MFTWQKRADWRKPTVTRLLKYMQKSQIETVTESDEWAETHRQTEKRQTAGQ